MIQELIQIIQDIYSDFLLKYFGENYKILVFTEPKPIIDDYRFNGRLAVAVITVFSDECNFQNFYFSSLNNLKDVLQVLIAYKSFEKYTPISKNNCDEWLSILTAYNKLTWRFHSESVQMESSFLFEFAYAINDINKKILE